MTICPGPNHDGSGGLGYVEALLNLLDPRDPRNMRMFDFIPERIMNYKQPINEETFAL